MAALILKISFSILFHIRLKRRRTFTPESLEDMLRIRKNGPKPDSFSALKYASLWDKAGNMLSDSGIQIRKRPTTQLDGEDGDDRFKYLVDGSNLFLKYHDLSHDSDY